MTPSGGREPDFDVLLFDLGGVLVDFAGFEELARLLPAAETDEAAPDLRERWIRSASVDRFESGDSTTAEFALRFLAEWPVPLSPDSFLRQFTTWARGPYPGARSLILELRRRGGPRLAAFSNANALHTPRHRADWGDLFDTMLFSNELRIAKPAPAAFARAVEELGVAPRRVAYFDDTESNVVAARQAGLAAWRTLGVDGLRARLQELGLLAGPR